MCEGYILYVMNRCSPTLEIRLPRKTGNPFGDSFKEGQQFDDVLARCECVCDAFG